MRRSSGVLACVALAALTAGARSAPPVGNVAIDVRDGRLEAALAALASASGQTIVLRPGDREQGPPRRVSTSYAGERWTDVLAQLCVHGDLGVERLSGGTLLVSRGPRVPVVRDHEVMAARGLLDPRAPLWRAATIARRPVLLGPSWRVGGAGRDLRQHDDLHWQRALRAFAPGAHVHAEGELIAIDQAPIAWGEPYGVPREVPGRGAGPLVEVRARHERLDQLVVRVGAAAGRTIQDLSGGTGRLLVTADLPPLPWRDALQAITDGRGYRVRERPDGGLVLEREARRTLVAQRAPLDDWLQLLAAALGTSVQVEGSLTGRVSAVLEVTDVANVLSATLALWRCEAAREPDGTLRVRQTVAVGDPWAPPPVPASWDAEVDAVVAHLLGETLQDPTVHRDALRRVQRSPDFEAAFAAWSRLPDDDDPRLDPLRASLLNGLHRHALRELEDARLSRDAARALSIGSRLRAVLDGRADPNAERRRVQEARLTRAMARVRGAAASWHLEPTALAFAGGAQEALACVGGRIVRAGDAVEDSEGRPPAAIVRIDPGALEYSREDGTLVFTVPLTPN